MNRINFIIGCLLLAVVSLAFGATLPDVVQNPTCSKCNMDRDRFGQSRMLVEYDDGSKVATCSIHCTAVDLATAIDKAPAKVLVADYTTRELIEADKASWVMGGKINGVMTARAKWAFATPAGAEQFINANGGEKATYGEALKAAYGEMPNDTKQIRERRKAKRLQQPSPQKAP